MIKTLLFILGFLFLTSRLNAINRLSNAVVGNWNAATSWAAGVVPGANDTAVIVNGANITLNVASAQIFNLQINTGGTFNCGANTLALFGVFTNSGIFNCGTGTIHFNGFAFKQTIQGASITTFYNIIVDNTNGTSGFGVTAHPVETIIRGNFTNNGVFNRNCTSFPTAYVRFVGPATILTGTNSLILHHVIIDPGAVVSHQTANLYVTGDWTNNGTFNPNTNTVNFEFSSCGLTSENVDNNNSNFYNVRVNKPATFTVNMVTNTRILNNFDIIAGTWSSQTFSLNVGGNFINNGTYLAGTGIVLLNGAANQDIDMSTSTLYNFRINKPTGNVYALSIVEVTNFADLIKGIFFTHQNVVAPSTIYELYINNTNPATSLTGYSANSFVVGRLRRQVIATATNYTFAVGPMNILPVKYRPIVYKQSSSGGAANLSIIGDTISAIAHKANWRVRISPNVGAPTGSLTLSYNLSMDFNAGMPECAISTIRGSLPANWNYVLNTVTPAAGGNNGFITSTIPTTLSPYYFILGEASPIALGATICSGNTATLSITSPTGFVQFDWWNAPTAGAQVSTNTNSLVTPTLTTTTSYYIQTTTATCAGIRTPVTVSVIANPTISFNNAAPLICVGGSFSIVASGVLASSYVWSNGSTATNSIVVSPTNNAVYTVSGTGVNGCKTTATVNVLVNAAPNFISAANGLSCNGNTTQISANFGSGIPVTWYSDAALTQSLAVNNGVYFPTTTSAGSYTYYAQGAVGLCTSAAVAVILQNNYVVASFNSNTSSGNLPLNVSFNNTSTGVTLSDIFYWNFNNGSTATSYNAATTFVNSGNYSVTLIASNGPCSDTASTIITVNVGDIFIPEVLTPNSDGHNDVFEIKNIDAYTNNELLIYNRWGNLIYSMKGYNNTWDGTPNVENKTGSQKLPSGSYFYILNLGDSNNKLFKGFVQLMY